MGLRAVVRRPQDGLLAGDGGGCCTCDDRTRGDVNPIQLIDREEWMLIDGGSARSEAVVKRLPIDPPEVVL